MALQKAIIPDVEGGTKGVAPKPAIPPTPLSGYATPVAPLSGGGGGGGGGGMELGAPARPSLDDYIKSNFLYTQQMNENGRRLDDYDAESLRLRQDTEADQGVRRGQLRRDLDDAGQSSAEGLAGRGLLRSGFTFQAQDRINAEGVQRENMIAALLSDLIGNRQSGRVQQEAANRDALNQKIADITTQFNSSQSI